VPLIPGQGDSAFRRAGAHARVRFGGPSGSATGPAFFFYFGARAVQRPRRAFQGGGGGGGISFLLGRGKHEQKGAGGRSRVPSRVVFHAGFGRGELISRGGVRRGADAGLQMPRRGTWLNYLRWARKGRAAQWCNPDRTARNLRCTGFSSSGIRFWGSSRGGRHHQPPFGSSRGGPGQAGGRAAQKKAE